MQIGWIGTGLMGLPMVRRAVSAGHEVAVVVRNQDKLAALADAGVTVCRDFTELVTGREVIVTLLSFPDDVYAVYAQPGGLLAVARPGSTLVDMTTSSVTLARELADSGRQKGIDVLDAPVSGAPTGAEQGRLSIMVGGEDEAVARVGPLLACLGTTIVHHGPAGYGQLAKLLNQVLVAGVTEATCEAFALARAGALDVERLATSLRAGAAGSALFEFLWTKLCDGDERPGFKVEHFVKDLTLVAEVAAAAGLRLPATDETRSVAERVLNPDAGTQTLVDQIAPGLDWRSDYA